MEYDGQNPLKVTADRSICLSPAWSPDGKVLAYVSYRDRNPDLFALDMDTGKRWKMSGNEGLNISPAWSPNGKRHRPGPVQGWRHRDLHHEQERERPGAAYLRHLRQCVSFVGAERQGDRLHLGQGGDAAALRHERRRDRCPPDHLRRNVQRLTATGHRGETGSFSRPRSRGLFKIATVNPDGSDFRILTSGRGATRTRRGRLRAGRSCSARTARGSPTFIS